MSLDILTENKHCNIKVAIEVILSSLKVYIFEFAKLLLGVTSACNSFASFVLKNVISSIANASAQTKVILKIKKIIILFIRLLNRDIIIARTLHKR